MIECVREGVNVSVFVRNFCVEIISVSKPSFDLYFFCDFARPNTNNSRKFV